MHVSYVTHVYLLLFQVRDCSTNSCNCFHSSQTLNYFRHRWSVVSTTTDMQFATSDCRSKIALFQNWNYSHVEWEYLDIHHSLPSEIQTMPVSFPFIHMAKSSSPINRSLSCFVTHHLSQITFKFRIIFFSTILKKERNSCQSLRIILAVVSVHVT